MANLLDSNCSKSIMSSSTNVLNISDGVVAATASAEAVRTFGGVLCGGRSPLFHSLAGGGFSMQTHNACNILFL